MMPNDDRCGGCGSRGDNSCEVALQREETVTTRVDEQGREWRKIYFGMGAHFDNWLAQAQEIYGDDRIWVEEVEEKGLQCIAETGGRMKRIWILSNP